MSTVRNLSWLVAMTTMLSVLNAAAADSPSDAKVTPLLTRPLGGVASKEGLLLMVEYAPGGASPSHRHNANTFVYVLEGSIVMQVMGGAQMTLQAGETFYEHPTDVHSISRNASASQPAKFLVFMVKDTGAPVTLPVE